MTLNRFFKKNRINIRKWAEDHDFSYGTIRNVSAGLTVPGKNLSLRISRATNEEVGAMELMFPDRPKKKRAA